VTTYVDTELRALVIESADPRLLQIPSAFELEPGFVGMPHDADTAIRLAAAGIKAPRPIDSYYRWPRERTLVPEPFFHQTDTAGFLTVNPRAYVLNGIGTGKTLAAAWAADYLIEIGAARRWVISSPLSTLERVWGDTFFFHMRHRKFVILHGTAERRRKLLATPADFYIINHDGVGVIQKELEARDDIDGVILDEGAEYSNKQTAKWKAMDRVIYPGGRLARPWVWSLTATPRPTAASDVYGQCKLVTPTSVPQYFTTFRNMVMEHHSTYVWTDRAEANKIIHQVMQPAIRYKREECLDLPPEIYSTRDVEMSTDQVRHYKAIMKELHTEIEGGRITALNEGIKLSKLLQIACGCVYDTDGVPRELGDGRDVEGRAAELNPGNRIETLIQLIEQIGEKVIVFVPFTAVTAMLHRHLKKYWNFVIVTGDTPVRERNQIFSDFQSTKDLDLLAHPGCMSHGLTLTEASTIVWYAPIDSARIYEQANGRITRAGQKYTANIIHLAGSPVERRMYKRLEARQQAQGLLLEMVERGEQ
jgi:SNF2 family DNA or RNA helicase